MPSANIIGSFRHYNCLGFCSLQPRSRRSMPCVNVSPSPRLAVVPLQFAKPPPISCWSLIVRAMRMSCHLFDARQVHDRRRVRSTKRLPRAIAQIGPIAARHAMLCRATQSAAYRPANNVGRIRGRGRYGPSGRPRMSARPGDDKPSGKPLRKAENSIADSTRRPRPTPCERRFAIPAFRMSRLADARAVSRLPHPVGQAFQPDKVGRVS